jgi:hypothetical protein
MASIVVARTGEIDRQQGQAGRPRQLVDQAM